MKNLAKIAIVLNGLALVSFVLIVIGQGYADYIDMVFLVTFSINMGVAVNFVRRVA